MEDFNFKLSAELRNKEEIPDYTYKVEFHNNDNIAITWIEEGKETMVIKATKTTQEEIDRNINNSSWIVVE